MNVDALLEEIDRIARSYNLEYGLPINPIIISTHAAPTQALREAVSRFVEEVKKAESLPDPWKLCVCGHNRAQHDRDRSPYLCRAAIEEGTRTSMCLCMDFAPAEAKKEMTNGSGTCATRADAGADTPAVHLSGDTGGDSDNKVADAALPSAPQKCPRCGSEKKHQFVWNYSRHNGCTEDAYHEFHNGWEDSVPDAVPPAQREAEGALRESEPIEGHDLPPNDGSRWEVYCDGDFICDLASYVTKLKSQWARTAAPPTKPREIHTKTVPVQVWVDVDVCIAAYVERLQTIPGVRTHASCQGTIGEGGAEPYPAYIEVSWMTPDAKAALGQFNLEVKGDGWGTVYPRVLAGADRSPDTEGK
jgi:hypothetical protein